VVMLRVRGRARRDDRAAVVEATAVGRAHARRGTGAGAPRHTNWDLLPAALLGVAMVAWATQPSWAGIWLGSPSRQLYPRCCSSRCCCCACARADARVDGAGRHHRRGRCRGDRAAAARPEGSSAW
jgi:hypothetical protein